MPILLVLVLNIGQLCNKVRPILVDDTSYCHYPGVSYILSVLMHKGRRRLKTFLCPHNIFVIFIECLTEVEIAISASAETSYSPNVLLTVQST